MPPAARTGDPTVHGGLIGTPPPGAVAVATVLIGGRPAAVTGSLHVCVIPPHALLGPGNVILPSPAAAVGGMVLIGGLPAARSGKPQPRPMNPTALTSGLRSGRSAHRS